MEFYFYSHCNCHNASLSDLHIPSEMLYLITLLLYQISTGDKKGHILPTKLKLQYCTEHDIQPQTPSHPCQLAMAGGILKLNTWPTASWHRYFEL